MEFESKNWRLLEAQRITIANSFDFSIESVGVFSNDELVKMATHILTKKLTELANYLEKDKLKIVESDNTMKNCYDIVLENEDYTIGKTLEYMLYSKFFEGDKELSFCGFKKMHPHDTDSIVRVAYKKETDPSIIKQHIMVCLLEAGDVFKKIGSKF